MGLNGAEGNSRDTNFTIGFDAEHTVGLNTITLDLDYFFQRESSEVTKNRLYALGRNERAIPDSAWSWFTDAWFEYDQFEGWRSRIGLHIGASVLLHDTDCQTLKGRLGLGTSKKARGPDRAWKPEGLLGADYVLKLTKCQTFKANVDYYPDAREPGDSYRINTKAGWELLLDEARDLRLAVRVFDRYDSRPDPGDPTNELDYWLSLHWGF